MANGRFKLLSIFVAFALCGALADRREAYAAEQPHLRLEIRVQSDEQATLVSRLEIASPELAKALVKAKTAADAPAPDPEQWLDDVAIVLQEAQPQSESGEAIRFRLDRSGQLWRVDGSGTAVKTMLAAAYAKRLQSYADGLREQHYGKLLTWEEAERVFPRKSLFAITDLETGLTFRVQRRAGSDHADVQPLTRQDTKIMKQIYDSRWSWKRRAILVHDGPRWVAASMNGMPHGGDGIPDNGFSGHFCVHFLHSTTHKSDEPDLEHQLMVYKAAGQLRAFLDPAAPTVLAESFVTAMDYQDEGLLRHIAAGLEQTRLDEWVAEMHALQSVRSLHHPKPERRAGDGAGDRAGDNAAPAADKLSAQVKLPVSVKKIGGRERRVSYLFELQRESAQAPWRIADVRTDDHR